MMEIKILAPDTAPEFPKQFKELFYQVVNENFDISLTADLDDYSLNLARTHWIENGYKRLRLIAILDALPAYPDFQIYSEWDEEKAAWGEWLNYQDGEKFDLEHFYRIDEPCNTCHHPYEEHTRNRCKESWCDCNGFVPLE